MRGGLWALAILGVVLWGGAVGYPAIAAGWTLAAQTPTDVDRAGIDALLLTTTAWAAAVALGAVVLGWAPGRVLGRSLRRGRFAATAFAFALPVCLPAYLVFYAWWQSWPADSAAYRWAVEHELIRELRLLTLYLSLVCWSWPLVAWCSAGLAGGDSRERQELLQIDGARLTRRVALAVRVDAPGLLLGGAIVFLLTFQNTTCFDLAEVFTFGNELRALAQRGGNARDLLGVAGPALALSLLGAATLWTMLARSQRRFPRHPARTGRAMGLTAALVWVATIAAPLGMLVAGLDGWDMLRRFARFYGPGLANALVLASISGTLAALVAVGLAGQWGDRRRWVRWPGHLLALGWILGAVVPATMTAIALESAYNIPVIVAETHQNVRESLATGSRQSEITVADLLYRSPVILLLGHLSRFGAVGALFGWWLVRQEPRPHRDVRELEGATHLRGWLTAMGRPVLAAAAGAFAVVLVLSIGEISVTAQLQPPGIPLIASTILNDMHYQRPQTVMIAAAVFVALAAGAAAVVALGGVAMRRPATLGIIAVLAVTGCSRVEPGVVVPIDADLTFGTPGLAPGQFNYPRGIAVDASRGRLFVVDKTARVQRFSLDGTPEGQWRMPEFELGKPTGLNVAPDGTIFVADTHYFRVIRYDAEGRELMRFGSYGEEPGQFIYPTDIAFGADGRLYVSEYGGNDRVQVFSAEGDLLFSFGEFGAGVGRFNRPQSMAFSRDGTELFIADACNHRIVVTDPSGRTLRTIGGPGRDPGELMYPYDIVVLEDGSLLVCEFGNNRIQRLGRDGRSLELRGGEGPGPGRLRYPWGVDVAEDRMYVLDSGNNRVQVADL